MKILVIGASWVGEMLMSHSLYRSLKAKYPYAQIDVMSYRWLGYHLLLDRMPEVRQVLTVPLWHGNWL